MSAKDPVSVCKICLKGFPNETAYNAHIESFKTDEDYAAHIDKRPEGSVQTETEDE